MNFGSGGVCFDGYHSCVILSFGITSKKIIQQSFLCLYSEFPF